MDAQQLAKRLLTDDPSRVAKAVAKLMRWPRVTLGKHGIFRYDKKTKTFELSAYRLDKDTQAKVVDACDEAIEKWEKEEATNYRSRFYAVIQRAEGRCEACGIPGNVRPIDVDHIIPRTHAIRGKVKLSNGDRVPVDDVRNLQALCMRCNRGKRDTSTVDRPDTALADAAARAVPAS